MLERSLDNARVQALARSGEFVHAALALLEEEGSVEFTVQDVVRRSGGSLRRFYQLFSSKDDLVLALFEELITQLVEHIIVTVQAGDTPLDKLELCVRTLVGLCKRTGCAAGEAHPFHGRSPPPAGRHSARWPAAGLGCVAAARHGDHRRRGSRRIDQVGHRGGGAGRSILRNHTGRPSLLAPPRGRCSRQVRRAMGLLPGSAAASPRGLIAAGRFSAAGPWPLF